MKTALEGSAQILQSSACKPPLISVVLPTFNRASMLHESIESVLRQTERDLELIVVNDGSSDATDEVVRRYAQRDDRVTHLKQNNLGLPRALNNGFRLARGGLLTWTSDDNRYFPDALAIMARYLVDHPAVGLVYAEMLWRTPQGLIYYAPPKPDDFWRENPFGGAFMYKRAVAESAGEYEPGLAMVEDYDFFLRASYYTTIRRLPYVVYEFRQHGDSLTTVRKPEQVLALERLLKRHNQLGKAKPWQLSSLAATISGIYRRSGKPRDSVRLALLA